MPDTLATSSGKRLLIVDDDPVILKALSMKLKTKGYEVFTAMDGANAVKLVRTQRPDLILLDLTFPPEVTGVPWDGFRIMDWLKRMDEAVGIPILVITGNDPAKYEMKAKDAGATAFFRKPIDNEELLYVIEKEFGKRPTAA
jgi:two-component system, OmpR family, KDP operon response regulator KdpE